MSDLTGFSNDELGELVREVLARRRDGRWRDSIAEWREHRYVGGPPPLRLRRMQIQHETIARHLGVVWKMVDLRRVYARFNGRCGICGEPVDLEIVAFDHVVPLSRGGPHVFDNLQPAHTRCNSRKGNRTDWLPVVEVS